MIFLTGSPEIALFFDLNQLHGLHSVENCGKFGLLVSTLSRFHVEWPLYIHIIQKNETLQKLWPPQFLVQQEIDWAYQDR
jgi:hypothetical protein